MTNWTNIWYVLLLPSILKYAKCGNFTVRFWRRGNQQKHPTKQKKQVHLPRMLSPSLPSHPRERYTSWGSVLKGIPEPPGGVKGGPLTPILMRYDWKTRVRIFRKKTLDSQGNFFPTKTRGKCTSPLIINGYSEPTPFLTYQPPPPPNCFPLIRPANKN